MTRRVTLAAALTIGVAVLLGCSSSSRSSTTDGGNNDLPPDLVPASAVHAQVTVETAGASITVRPDVVAAVVPLLVRRTFDPTESPSSYGLDAPTAHIVFFLPDGEHIILYVGALVFDKTAYYVQRSGDARIWLVLTASIDPLLQEALVSTRSLS
jgi:hypothetical protein